MNDELNQYIYAAEYKTDMDIYRSLPKVHNSVRNILYETELHVSLVECIKHHRFILDICTELEEMFNPYCLVKSLQITFQLCLLVFVGVAVSTIQYISF